MLSEEAADIIIPLHVITGSDHTSGFYGHGKKKVLAKVMSDPKARELLRRVGERSSKMMSKQRLSHVSSPSSVVRVQILPVGRPELQRGTNLRNNLHST